MEEDWRLRGQEDYLMGKTLHFIRFQKRSEIWDHEHCEFCWAKFSDNDGDLHEGYCTETDNKGNAFWICPECYQDFKDKFSWKLSK